MAGTYHTSSAIAYERFSPAVDLPQQQPAIEVLPQKKLRARAVPYGKYAAVMLCVFGVLLAIVFSYMQLSILASENDRLKDSIAALDSEQNALSARKEQMYNLTFVEEYARETLGMVKLDKSQIVYLDLSDADCMELADSGAEEGSALWRNVARSFSAVLEYLN